MAQAGMVGGGVPAPGAEQRLLDWMARQHEISAAFMLRAISATHLVKVRKGFGLTIRPARGSILASAAMGSWDPDPDYFFHWLRDSAIVIDALRHLISAGTHVAEGSAHCRDYVAFSQALNRLDGDEFLRNAGDFRKSIDPGFLQFVRDDSEFRGLKGDRVLGEPRFNPDGTLDISKWSRPQHDGPAMRALGLMRLWPLGCFDETDRAAMRALLLSDLGFVFRHWREPSFDIWEEELGQHYATRLLHHAALMDGADWIEENGCAGETEQAGDWRKAAHAISEALDAHWLQGQGYYASRQETAKGTEGKDLDFAVILAVIHAQRKEGPHSVLDPKVMATMARLEDLFAGAYAINKNRPARRGPAMGRYAGDSYFSGGAYYFSTLGAAEFYYALAGAAAGARLPGRLAHASRLPGPGARKERPPDPPQGQEPGFEALLRRGDQFMETVAAFTPPGGELSEQFDQRTGAQTSAKTLSWSHAAFITAYARRREAVCRFAAQTGTAA